MKILIATEDVLEAQGIEWVLKSRWNDIEVVAATNVPDVLAKEQAEGFDYTFIDLGMVEASEIHLTPAMWTGISSERTFHKTYEAFQKKADQLLFRPFLPEALIPIVQQAKFRLRNATNRAQGAEGDKNTFTHHDVFLGNKTLPPNSSVAMIVPKRKEEKESLLDALTAHVFSFQVTFLPLSEGILLLAPTTTASHLKKSIERFSLEGKKTMQTLFSAYLLNVDDQKSLPEWYQQVKSAQQKIFYEGFDIVSIEEKVEEWCEFDPFLTPVEQREWIEMLERQDKKGVKKWLEHHFFVLEDPYPDPELVRIRLTSVLAQLRRYMTTYRLKQGDLERRYHALFEKTVHGVVMYDIVQQYVSFAQELLHFIPQKGSDETSTAKRVHELVERNYWNPDWGLAECASHLSVHKSTLSRRFLKEQGVHFRDYVLAFRVQEAKRLLLETSLPVKEIARLTGFRQASYFTQKFKESTGVFPSHYKSMQQSNIVDNN
ncbi:response regulator transcription factor [Paenisporosarcina cavernae]|uniref:AraC family transcriptional regulator n=1 Tax=Paenisporosarcina cavernae TaxID=2320858 RepID=A0A385YWJ5_9BACL|nr:response regulator transcription factor [Paenisporosarcina cavernae]AYC30650.1 AraC family transcriptional regulator [Paenisporosarcina cavernae]